MDLKRRHSRREAIAFAFWQDIADVEEYQSTRRGSVPIYQINGNYAVALRDGESAPDGYDWHNKGTEYGYRVLWSM
jgi:hypothetical protein